MSDDEVNLKALSEKDLLLRIAQELTSIRKSLLQVTNYMVDAESEIPEKMRRFIMYFHDVHDLINLYHGIGQEPPEYIKSEARRCDDRFRQLVKDLTSEGGVFAKVRAEMAGDPENRWDHTRLLPKGVQK